MQEGYPVQSEFLIVVSNFQCEYILCYMVYLLIFDMDLLFNLCIHVYVCVYM